MSSPAWRTHPRGPDPIFVVCVLLLHLRLFAAFCYKADNFFYALSAIDSCQEVEQSWVTNATRRANYALSGFSRTSLASRLERFDLKAINLRRDQASSSPSFAIGITREDPT